MANEPFEYLALSHMWGEKYENQLQLYNANLAEFQIDIPWTKLTATLTFREAIRITYVLGYRFLWIDSLCIIQDSRSDWDEEACRMADIYGNAICNIAYLFPSDANFEPMKREDPRSWYPCVLRPATPINLGTYFDGGDYIDDWLDQYKWPLFRRAWTFQEYLLSPRTLLVGHKNLMFQCSELFYDELLGPIGDGHGLVIDEKHAQLGKDLGKSRYFPASVKAVSTASKLSDAAVLSFLTDWWKLVNEYRARKLTKAEDRVMAFAGVAQAVQRLGNLTYLAGLWKECLPLSLLWCVDKKETWVARQEHGLSSGTFLSYDAEVRERVEKAAPTWSWFSIPIYAFHEPNLLLLRDDIPAENELSFRRKNNRDIACFDEIFWASTLHFQFCPHPKNHFPKSGFSDFEGLEITLQTPILPVSMNWPADLHAQASIIRTSTTSTEDQDFDCDPIFKYFPDSLDKASRKIPKDGIYALIMEAQVVRLGGNYMIQRRLAGLILVPGEKENTWKRVGAWKLKMRVCDVEVNKENMKDVAARWKEYRFVSTKWKTETLTLV